MYLKLYNINNMEDIMKKVIFGLIILIVAVGFTFASGNKEAAQPAPWSEEYPCFPYDQEEVTVTGKLVLEDDQWPRLLAGEKEYLLMYPYGIDLDADITSGEEITVKGYVRVFKTAEDVEYAHLMVNRATIDGKEYIFAGPGMHYNGGPRGPHMMGGNLEYGPHMRYR